MKRERNVGAVLRRIRTEGGLSQDEIAARVGVSRSHIGRFESGEKIPNLKMLFRLAEALGIPASDIILEVEKE